MRKKIKNVAVSSRSFFGQPSQMDKELEKWTNQGWTFAHSKPLGKNRLLLTFEYIPEEGDTSNKKKSNPIGCVVLLGVVFGCYLAFNAVRSSSTTTPPTQQITATQRQIAVAPTRTSAPTRVLPTNTPKQRDASKPTSKPASPVPTYTPSPTPVAVIVNSNQNVNLRQEPNTTASIIDVLEPQASLVVLKENEDGTWLNVRTDDDKTGWIAASLVTGIANDTSVAVAPTRPNAQIVCVPNFKQIGGFFRLYDSGDDTDYNTYYYKVDGLSFNTDHYTVTLFVGKEWEGALVSVTIYDYYEGQIMIEDVPVDYLYEGEPGIAQAIGFSFEYADLKFSGDVTNDADSASSRDNAHLREVLEYFVSQIVDC